MYPELGASALDAFNARQKAVASAHGVGGAIFVTASIMTHGDKAYTCHCGVPITQDEQGAWGHES